MIAGPNSRQIVMHYEGKGDGDDKKPNLQPYICPAGVCTLGYGHALYHPITGQMLKVSVFGHDEALKQGYFATIKMYGRDGITDQEAEKLLDDDMAKFAVQVDAKIGGISTSQGQFDAMTSLAFNVGMANFGTSTLLRWHRSMNRNPGPRNIQIAAQHSRAQQINDMSEAFGAWSFANGAWLTGLFRRHWAESGVYFGQSAQQAILIADAYKR